MRTKRDNPRSQGRVTAAGDLCSPEASGQAKSATVREMALDPMRHHGLVPLKSLHAIGEVDAILRAAVGAGRKRVHAAIDEVMNGWRGRKRSEAWAVLRQIRNEGRKNGQRAPDWSEEELEILRTYYAQGRAGARRAVRELRSRRPDRSPRSIWRKAAKLKFSNRSEKPRAWSRRDRGYLRWHSGEKPVEKLAQKLRRSVKAVRQMLSAQGMSGRVRPPQTFSLRGVARLLGVSKYSVGSWFRAGLFGESPKRGSSDRRPPAPVRIAASAVIAFCQEHPDRINTAKCHPDFWMLMEDRNVQPNVWLGNAQHLTKQRQCPGCRRVVRGNAYFRHVKRCMNRGHSASGIEPGANTAHQRSLSSNV